MSWTKSTSCWCFDVDGVVADTRQAVRQAYTLAGVTQPEEAWGISWKVWLPALVGDAAAEVHAEKQRQYVKLLEQGAAARLPGADAANALLQAGQHVYFVTAASYASARAVLRLANLPADRLSDCELSPSGRVVALRKFVLRHPDLAFYVYVDDREEGAAIAAEAGYSFAHARWTR